MNKLHQRLLTIVTIVSVTTLLFILRWTFTNQINLNQLNDLYGFSQWSIPFSSRIMGDAALYQYAGYKLYEDFEPFDINPEAPILGKLMIGSSIRQTGNPHFPQYLMLFVLLIPLYFIAKKFLKFDHWHARLLILLVGTSPIILEQIPLTLLDLPQTTFFIAHVFFIFLAGKEKYRQKSLIFTILAGIFLGAMTATKIALYLPVVFLVDAWYLWRKGKTLYIFEIIFTSLSSYAFVYAPYIAEHGFLPWLKAQKWMISFYQSSDVRQTPGMILLTSFTGWYKGWWGDGWERVQSWSGSWALGISTVILSIYKIYKKKTNFSTEHLYFLLISALTLLILIIIPFWARYLVFMVPLFWINVMLLLKNKKAILLLLLFPVLHTIIFATNTMRFNPTPFYSTWELGSFVDMPQYFSSNSSNFVNKDRWLSDQNQELMNNNVMSILLTPGKSEKPDFFTHKQSIEVRSTSPKNVNLSKYEIIWKLENNQWKIDSIERFHSQDSVIETEKNGFLCINPTNVKDWSEVYVQVAHLLRTQMDDILQRTMTLAPRDYCIPIQDFNEHQESQPIDYKAGVEYVDFSKEN